MPRTSRACSATASSRECCSPRAHPATQQKAHGPFHASGEQPHSPNPSIKCDLRRERSGSRRIAPAQCPGPALDFPVVLGIVRRGVSKVGHIANLEIAVVFYFKAKSVEQGQ